MNYSEKLKDPRWQKKRLEILQRDGWTCQYCGDKETTLHIHHFTYAKSRNPWDVEDIDLITYCEHCHTIVEKYNKEALRIIKINGECCGGVYYVTYELNGFSIYYLADGSKEIVEQNYIADEVVLELAKEVQKLVAYQPGFGE